MENLLAGRADLARGDGSEMAALVAHLDAAYNLAQWLLRNSVEAEDAVQDAYVRAFRHFKSFRGGDGRAWLLAIVRNCCFDRLRQRTGAEDGAFDEQVHLPGETTLNPEASLLRKEKIEEVRRALKSLSPQLREVLVLREFEDMSYLQIAAVVQIPLGTVMSRLSRARQQLQQIVFPQDEAKETA